MRARTTDYKFTLPNLIRMTVAVYIRQTISRIYGMCESYGERIFTRNLCGILTESRLTESNEQFCPPGRKIVQWICVGNWPGYEAQRIAVVEHENWEIQNVFGVILWDVLCPGVVFVIYWRYEWYVAKIIASATLCKHWLGFSQFP